VDTISQEILDSKTSEAKREALIAGNLEEAPSLLRAMTSNLAVGTPEEYRRIPWIWRVSVAVGKGNRSELIKGILDVSLPKEGEPLQHWQAVVIGGGIINGLGLQGSWPGERVAEILQGDEEMKARWERSLELASVMADDEKVPTGTRYDALRMIALQPWVESGEQLLKYLGKGVHGELQQGAISGLSDMKAAPVADALISNLAHFSPANREFALKALLRDEQRLAALREAVRVGKIDQVPPEVLTRLRE
jgi:hypothetical protein